MTNNPDSPLAEVSEFHIDLLAGPEKALPATKTYTAELLALYLFVEGLGGGDGAAAAALPDLAEQVLARGDEVRELAGRYRFAERMVITSRGYGYPTAKEAALKLMETSYIPALAYSGADLLHGPLAMVDNISPVIAIVHRGPRRRGPAAGPRPAARPRRRPGGGRPAAAGRPRPPAASSCPPRACPRTSSRSWRSCRSSGWPRRSPIARGQDPDAPRAIAKVTETQLRPRGRCRAAASRDGTRRPASGQRRGPGGALRAAVPGEDPQPLRHRSPELTSAPWPAGCAVPAGPIGPTARRGVVRAENARPRSALLCGERRKVRAGAIVD